MRRTLFLLAPLLCAMATALAPLHAAGDEVRALWVRRASVESDDALRRMVTAASTAGFNTVLVQAEDDAMAAAQGFDSIGETILQAHAAGLRVHAWGDVARVTAPGGLPFQPQ